MSVPHVFSGEQMMQWQPDAAAMYDQGYIAHYSQMHPYRQQHQQPQQQQPHPATACHPPATGNMLDVGCGIEAQIVGQWGSGYIVAVPADQPMPNGAWLPVPFPVEPSPMASASGPSRPHASMQPEINQSQLYCNQPAASAPLLYSAPPPNPVPMVPSIPVVGDALRQQPHPMPGMQQPMQHIRSQDFERREQQHIAADLLGMNDAIRQMPTQSSSASGAGKKQIFVHQHDGGLRPILEQHDCGAGHGDSQAFPAMANDGASSRDAHLLGMAKLKVKHGEISPKVLPSSERRSGTPTALRHKEIASPTGAKIFVHDSDGNLHHVAKCSQNSGGFEVKVLEQTPQSMRNLESVGEEHFVHGDPWASLSGWNSGRAFENFPEARSQSSRAPVSQIDYRGSNGSPGTDEASTSADSCLPSPCPSSRGGGPGSGSTASSSADSYTPANYVVPPMPSTGMLRKRHMAARPPTPPPPPLPEEERYSRSSHQAESSHRPTRRRSKQSTKADEHLSLQAPTALEAAALRSPSPDLPSGRPRSVSSYDAAAAEEADANHTLIGETSSELQSSMVESTSAPVEDSVSIPAPQPKARHMRQPKGAVPKRMHRNSNPVNVAGELRNQLQASTTEDSSQSASSSQPMPQRKADDIWKQLRRKANSMRSLLRTLPRDCWNSLEARGLDGPRLALGASLVLLMCSFIFSFGLGIDTQTSTILTREPALSMYAWPTTSPLYGDRRVGPVQQRLDIEAARITAVVSRKKDSRKSRSKYSSSSSERDRYSSYSRKSSSSGHRLYSREDYEALYSQLYGEWMQSIGRKGTKEEFEAWVKSTFASEAAATARQEEDPRTLRDDDF